MRQAFTSLALFALACGQSGTNDGASQSPGVAGGAGAATTAGAAGSSGAGGAGSAGSSNAGVGGSLVATAGAGGTASQGTAGSTAGSAGTAGGVGGGGGVSGGGGAAGGGAAGTAGAGGAVAGASGSGGGANPEGVPADYKLVIDETFASAASLAKLRFANPNDWAHQATDGGYIEATGASYAPPQASPHSMAIFGELQVGAFVLEAEVMQTNPSGGHRDFCFFWGIVNPSRFYYSHIAEAHDGVAHNIHIVLDADRKAITTFNTPGYAWGTNVWHKFRVSRTATGDMAVAADGVAAPILTASDARIGAGYLGIGSFDDKGRVRNVKVWAPSSTAQTATFFTTK